MRLHNLRIYHAVTPQKGKHSVSGKMLLASRFATRKRRCGSFYRKKISTLITEYDLYSSGIVEQAFTLFDILLYVYDTAEGIMPQIKRRVKDMDALYEELEEIKLK